MRWRARGPRRGSRAGVVVARHRFGFNDNYGSRFNQSAVAASLCGRAPNNLRDSTPSLPLGFYTNQPSASRTTWLVFADQLAGRIAFISEPLGLYSRNLRLT